MLALGVGLVAPEAFVLVVVEPLVGLVVEAPLVFVALLPVVPALLPELVFGLLLVLLGIVAEPFPELVAGVAAVEVGTALPAFGCFQTGALGVGEVNAAGKEAATVDEGVEVLAGLPLPPEDPELQAVSATNEKSISIEE